MTGRATNPDRLQAIADVLSLPVSVFFDEQEPALDDLRRALISAAEAFNQGIQRKAQSVSLAGQN